MAQAVAVVVAVAAWLATALAWRRWRRRILAALDRIADTINPDDDVE